MKKILSVILVISMVLPCAGFCFAAEDHNVMLAAEKPTIKYVHLGDSFSNGFGFLEYDEVGSIMGTDINIPDTAPALVAEYLSSLNPDAELEFHNMGCAGFRTEEAAALLDENQEYTYVQDVGSLLEAAYLGYSIAELKAGEFGPDYIAKVKDADIVSIQFGDNSIENYLPNAICYQQDDLPKLLELKGILDQWTEIRSNILGRIKSCTGVDFGSEEYKDLNVLVDGVLYAVWSFMDSFDSLCREIYELNPDVQLYVFGIPAIMPDMMADVGFGPLPLGILTNSLHTFMNVFMKEFSEYHDAFTFCDMSKVNVDLIGAACKKPVAEWSAETQKSADDFFKVYGLYDSKTPEMLETIHSVFNSRPVLLPCAASRLLPNGYKSLTGTDKEYENIRKFMLDPETPLSPEEKARVQNLIYTEFLYEVNFLRGMHPSKSGHKQMGQAIIAGIKKQQAIEAIKPVMKELPKLVTAGLTIAIPKITLDLKALEFKLHRPAPSHHLPSLPKLLPRF